MKSDLRETLAGLVCVGFDGSAPWDLDSRLFDVPFAGFILFARNVRDVAQTRTLCDRLQHGAGDLPRIIAIDQEGGRVARLQHGVEVIPPMMALAATRDPELAYRAGAQMGFDLARAGVNVDFAPVLDLALFARNTVIGARSFGEKPGEVVRFAGEFARGLQSQGIVPTYKHFPGHGSTDVDSHLDLPLIDVDAQVLRSRDLAPFRALLPQARAVMTAHVVARAFDTQSAATMSPTILGSLLREECSFGGVCFTDCMQMDAVARTPGTVEASIAAVAAGADCILISQSIDIAVAVVDALADAVERGRISRKRVESALRRVQTLRASLRARKSAPLAPYPGIGREIARRAITRIRGNVHAAAADVVVVSFESVTTEGVQGTHSSHARFPVEVPTLTLPLTPDDSRVNTLIDEISQLKKRSLLLVRRAHIYEEQLRAVQKVLDAYPQALIVCAREPYDAFLLPQAQHLLCCYGDDDACLSGLADVVFGARPAQGTLPITVPA